MINYILPLDYETICSYCNNITYLSFSVIQENNGTSEKIGAFCAYCAHTITLKHNKARNFI